MKNRDMPAKPCNKSISWIDEGGEIETSIVLGLTKLEYAAIHIMQVEVRSRPEMESMGYSYESDKDLAKRAIDSANALFDELEKQND